MRTLTKKARVVVVVALALCAISLTLLLGGLYYVFHLEDSLIQIRVDTKRGQDERQQLSALEALAKNTSTERGRLASYIVQDQGVINFLALVESVARAHGVTPNTQLITPTPLPGETLFENLVVTLSLSGSFEGIQSVIAQYENLPYQVHIEHVGMGTGNGQSATADLSLVVTKMKP